MIDVTLSVLALIAGGFSLELFASSRATLGYQDERGFRLGTDKRQSADDSPTGNPS